MNKFSRIPRKSRFNLVKLGIFAIFMGVAGQQLLRFSLAASGPTLFISPSSASVQKDATFDIQIRLDTAGQSVDGVEAYLTYPTSQLQLVRTDGAGSAFGLELPGSAGNGNFVIRRVVNPDSSSTVTGPNLLVATVTLKALAGSGVAAVNYTPQSRVTAPSAGSGSVLAYMTGGQYTLAAPTDPPPPSSGSPTNNSPPPTGSTDSSGSTGPKNGNGQNTNKNTGGGSNSGGGKDQGTPPNTGTNSNNTNPSTEAKPSQPNILPVVKSSTNRPPHSIQRHTNVILLAKIAGVLLLLGGIGLFTKLLFTLRHHSAMIPATKGPSLGVLSYSYNSSDEADTPIETQVFKSSPDSLPVGQPPASIDNLKSANLPAPGDVIGPRDNS